jgi:hypothetical protein
MQRPDGETQQPSCPECGGPVEASPTCHTWPQTFDGKTTWMVCLPCDSATAWDCDADVNDGMGCGWSWTQGLNPRNPRAADNDAKRPSWAAQSREAAAEFGSSEQASPVQTREHNA